MLGECSENILQLKVMCTLKLNTRMVIEEIKRGGGDLLFSAQNLQESSDCAKNQAPGRSWLVIDVRI